MSRAALAVVGWLPSGLTLAGLACGGLALAVVSPAAAPGMALWLLAVVLDQLDGPAARRLRVVSAFGAHLDVVSDVVIYLAAPTRLLVELGAPGAALLYLLAGAVRMARDLAADAKDITLGAPALLAFVLIVFLGVPDPTTAAGGGLLAGVALLSPLRLSPRGLLRLGLTLCGTLALIVAMTRAFPGGA